MYHLGILLKCRLSFCKSKVGPETAFQQLSGDAMLLIVGHTLMRWGVESSLFGCFGSGALVTDWHKEPPHIPIPPFTTTPNVVTLNTHLLSYSF